ncbi:hypothetical protein [Streptomyces sp. NPDC101393]|uniref:hypothetical protein n=1 Tax=Streptomyces sp. NPDC101393 TaxID=3366141 RepID=UPI0038020385
MRMSRKAGLLITTAVCGALTLGTAGGAFASTDDAPARSDSVVSAPGALVPSADDPPAPPKILSNVIGVLRPVTDLLSDVLKADEGKLTPTQITQHSNAAKKAFAAAQQAKPAAGPAAPPEPRPGNGTNLRTHQAAPEPLADLQSKVDALLKATASGNGAAITSALKAAVAATVNILAGVAGV